MKNRVGFFRRVVTWLVQLPMHSRTQYTAPILRGMKFVNSLKQYSLAKVWRYPLKSPGQHKQPDVCQFLQELRIGSLNFSLLGCPLAGDLVLSTILPQPI